MKANKPEYDESIRDSINLQFNIHRHIDRMSKIINDAELDESRYNWAIEHLLVLLEPYGDPQFEEDKKKINEEYDPKINSTDSTQKERDLIREKNRKMFRALSYLIKRLRMGLETEGTEEIGGG